jgi:hypothetical protein
LELGSSKVFACTIDRSDSTPVSSTRAGSYNTLGIDFPLRQEFLIESFPLWNKYRKHARSSSIDLCLRVLRLCYISELVDHNSNHSITDIIRTRRLSAVSSFLEISSLISTTATITYILIAIITSLSPSPPYLLSRISKDNTSDLFLKPSRLFVEFIIPNV